MPQKTYSYRQNSRIRLTQQEIALIKNIFSESGYYSIESIGAALFNTKSCTTFYKSQSTVAQTVRRILRGERNIPNGMVECILELYKNDDRLDFLRKKRATIATISAKPENIVWDNLLTGYINQLRQIIPEVGIDGKIELVKSLDELVRKYLG